MSASKTQTRGTVSKMTVSSALARGALCLGLAGLLLAGGCMKAYVKSVGGEPDKTYSKIYFADYNTAWQSVLESLKSAQLDVSNREGGFIQTKWITNTAEKNFADSFGGGATFLDAQYRFKVTVAKAFYNGIPAVKVAVRKEQLIKRDVLEGWKAVETDAIDESTLLYRIGRIIYIRLKIAKLEEEKTRKELQDSGF